MIIDRDNEALSSPAEEGLGEAAAAHGGEEPAVEPGGTVPDCTLIDGDGQEHTLAELYRQRPLVLVFYRGHWCPFCRRQLQRLADVHPRISGLGAQLVAVAVDPPELNRRLSRDLELNYPLLSDTGGKTIDAFGIRNRLLGKRSDVPHPAIFIIDSRGRVLFREVRRNYRRRTSPGRLLRTLSKTLESHQP